MNDKVDAIQLWKKKEQAVQAIYLLTLEMSKSISKEDTHRVEKLLLRRQNWMNQVDDLEKRLCEVEALSSSELDSIKESIRVVGKKIQNFDDCNKKLALAKHNKYKENLRALGKHKQGMKAYIRNVRQLDGMYFDKRK